MVVIVVAVTATLSRLSGCSDIDHLSTDYNTSVDVPLSGWTSTDTLFYPVVVNEKATLQNPMQLGVAYQLGVSARITSEFPLRRLPMLLVVQQMDTMAGHTFVSRNLLRQEISPILRDSLGKPQGSTWGSLVSHETTIDQLTLRFDSVGNYRMLLTPSAPGLSALRGVASVGLTLTAVSP